eukprot:4195269-Ditylum_brightwellii.AAC.1
MEVDDEAGRTAKPFSDAMLPSLLCANVDHASFNTWKALSEKDRDYWPTIQVSFLRAAEKTQLQIMILLQSSELLTR